MRRGLWQFALRRRGLYLAERREEGGRLGCWVAGRRAIFARQARLSGPP